MSTELMKDVFAMESHTSALDSARLLSPGDSFVVDLPIRWGDCDALQHLNNTVFFRLMEEARMQLQVGSKVPFPKAHGTIMVHASCDFLRPVTYPATVRVTHTVAKLGRTSIEFDVVLAHAGDPQVVHARGRTVLVWMNFATGAATPWPQPLLEGLGAYLAPHS